MEVLGRMVNWHLAYGRPKPEVADQSPSVTDATENQGDDGQRLNLRNRYLQNDSE